MTNKGLWIRLALTVPLVAVFIFSGISLWRTERNYRAEAEIHESLLVFKPSLPESADVAETGNTDGLQSGSEEALPDGMSSEGQLPNASPTIYNEGIALLRERNADVVGWITVDGTAIDYPFVRAADNDFYLRRDIDKRYAYAGTIFMDYRCRVDFSSVNSILYGHNMNNGSMFAGLRRFANKEFFDNNTSGMVFLENENIPLEIFAFLVVAPVDLMAYMDAGGGAESYLDFLRKQARHWREPDLGTDDTLVTLSTCSYDFENARAVLVARAVGG